MSAAARARFCLALAWVASSVLGCAKASNEGKSEPAIVCPGQDAGPVVDPALLAFLSRARAAHHVADAYEESKDLPSAVRTLQSVVSGPVPGGTARPPEAREVLADTEARLADLESQQGHYSEALAHVEQGLALASEPSYFRGHLFETRGVIEERRAKSLEGPGKTREAQEATKASLEAFEEAMKIQAQVIEQSVPHPKQ